MKNVRFQCWLLLLPAFFMAGCSKEEKNEQKIDYDSLLVRAIYNNDLEEVKYLLGQGADPDLKRFEKVVPVIEAAGANNVELLKILYEAGADLDKKDHKEGYALSFAIFQGHLEAVKFLIEHGADINISTTKGVTPLYGAVAFKKLDLAEYLLDHEPDLNIVNSSGASILMMAIMNDFDEFAINLIEKGADVNAQTYGNKSTALILATQKNKYKIVKSLLENGADPKLVDVYHKTASNYAKSEDVKGLFGESNKNFIVSVDLIKEKAVYELFINYKNAMLAGDAEKAISYITKDSIQYYEDMRDLALNGKKEVIQIQNFVNMLTVLRLRLDFDAETLINMSGKDICINAIKKRWFDKESIKAVDIKEIDINVENAYAKVYVNGDLSEVQYHFVKEEGGWRMNTLPNLQIINLILLNMAMEKKIMVADFVFELLQSTHDSFITGNIWEPLVKQ